MTDVLAVGLSAWIIQDGNYGDVAVGDRLAFALEFYGSTLSRDVASSTAAEPSLRHVADYRYEVLAQVVHVRSHWWVIDAGIRLFRAEKPPAWVREGSWVTGAITVGVDPFFYFESLSSHADAPALIYDWSIEKIEMQTAPFIEVKPRLMARAPALLGWKQISKSAAWEDDDGRAEYLLQCRQTGSAPRRHR